MLETFTWIWKGTAFSVTRRLAQLSSSRKEKDLEERGDQVKLNLDKSYRKLERE